MRTLVRDLGVAPLSRYGLTAAGIPAVVLQAQQASSMKGNPIRLDDAELYGILNQALLAP